MEMPTLYTVGHSNRSLEALLDLLVSAGVETLIDVRAHPGSRHNPQFDEAKLRRGVESAGITYHWAGRQLGGRRSPRPDSPHRALEPAVRGYADYMQSDAFAQAATQLLRLAATAPAVILCAERLPEQCHRRLIADYLTLQGAKVIHLIDEAVQRDHLLSPELRRESSTLIYDRNTSGTLDL